MSDSARYTCSSNYSNGSTSNRSESSTEEADDTNIPRSSPPQKVRIRGNRKISPTPSLAASSDYVDYVDKTKESAEATPSTKVAPEATQAPSPATATPLQPAPTHKPCRPTHNTPATNESTTYKAKSLSRPPTTRTSRDATKMTHRQLDEVHTLHDRFHRASLRFGRTTETQINRHHNKVTLTEASNVRPSNKTKRDHHPYNHSHTRLHPAGAHPASHTTVAKHHTHKKYRRTAHPRLGNSRSRNEQTLAVKIEPAAKTVASLQPSTEEQQNRTFPTPFIALNLPMLDGNLVIYNGTIVTIHDNVCSLFTDFRYDSEWRICIGTLRNTAFLGKLSDDARVITWNNGNTWIRQEPSTPNESLATQHGPA